MKTFLLIIIPVLAFVIILFFFIKSREEKKMQEHWNAVLQSTTIETEISNIRTINKLMSSRHGSIEIIGNTRNKQYENMSNYSGDLDNIESVDVTFYWGNKKFKGTEWKPLDNSNLYIFFQE